MILTPTHQRNADTVKALYEYERNRDLERWSALWHDNGKQTFPWFEDAMPVVGIEALRTSTAAKFEARSEITIDDEVYPMADPQCVFAIVRASIGFRDPPARIDGVLWCRFLFDVEGKILEHQEVFDRSGIKPPQD